MLELPSPNRLTRIQSSDHILKHAFAGIFVYAVYLCFDFGFQFVYCGWLVEVHTIFQVCPQKEVRRSQIKFFVAQLVTLPNVKCVWS